MCGSPKGKKEKEKKKLANTCTKASTTTLYCIKDRRASWHTAKDSRGPNRSSGISSVIPSLLCWEGNLDWKTPHKNQQLDSYTPTSSIHTYTCMRLSGSYALTETRKNRTRTGGMKLFQMDYNWTVLGHDTVCVLTMANPWATWKPRMSCDSATCCQHVPDKGGRQ